MKQFTSDQHFNSSHINQFQPERYDFGNTNKMITKNLIRRQNCQVEPHHTVYMLGDFIIAQNLESVIKILNKLNGKIKLILGNHDIILYNKKISLPKKISVYNEILTTTLRNGYKMYMYHYPLLEQPNYYTHNTFHLFGHCHGKKSHPDPRALEISCNLHDYRLLSENKIIELLNQKCYN